MLLTIEDNNPGRLPVGYGRLSYATPRHQYAAYPSMIAGLVAMVEVIGRASSSDIAGRLGPFTRLWPSTSPAEANTIRWAICQVMRIPEASPDSYNLRLHMPERAAAAVAAITTTLQGRPPEGWPAWPLWCSTASVLDAMAASGYWDIYPDRAAVHARRLLP